MLAAAAMAVYMAAQAAEVRLEHLSLPEAELLFKQHSHELLAAQRSVENAEADIIIAGARPNPNLSVSSSSIHAGGIGAGSIASKRIDTIIGLSQVFERGGKATLRTVTAQALASASRRDFAETGRLQLAALRNAYYDLLLAQEKVRITSETEQLFQKSVDALNIRLKAGDIAAVDVSRMSVDALRAKNDARSAQADLEKARAVLAYLIGAEQDSGRLRASDTWPAINNAASGDIAAMIENRPDVRAAQLRIVAAETNRELSRALRTRDITAGVQFERFPGNDPRNSIGFSVSVPLFTQYYYDGEIRRAENELRAAREDLQRVRALAATELSRAASDLSATTERTRRFREVLVAAADKAAQGAEFAYNRGAIGLMDLLDARRQFISTRLEAIAAQADHARALSAWRAAAADGFEDEDSAVKQ